VRATFAARVASMICGAVLTARAFSASSSGPVIAVNTDDLRDPGGRTTTVYRLTGSRQVPRTSTTARPPAAVARAARAMAAAASTGVWVKAVTALTMLATQLG
jgi:hypothetical protein